MRVRVRACMRDAAECVVEAVAREAAAIAQATKAPVETQSPTSRSQNEAEKDWRTEGAMVNSAIEQGTHHLSEPTNGELVARRRDATDEVALLRDFADRQQRKLQRIGLAARELELHARKLAEACEATSQVPLAAPPAPAVSTDVVPRAPTLPFGKDRWQRKPINDTAIYQKITHNYAVEFVNDVVDAKGRPYVVGDKDEGTLCGAFPHALLRPKAGAYRNREVYTCSGAIDVVFTVRLFDLRVENRQDPARYAVTERDVLRDLQFVDDTEGFYERSLVFRFELQFDDRSCDDPNAEAKYVCVDPTDHERYAFKTQIQHNKLFRPLEDAPYARGHYEAEMIGGQASVQLSFGEDVISKNLAPRKTGLLFCVTSFCLNPYLNSLSNFVATSVPFIVKKDLRNDVRKSLRWVLDDEGRPVVADEALVTRSAPPRRGSVAKARSPTPSSCDERH